MQNTQMLEIVSWIASKAILLGDIKGVTVQNLGDQVGIELTNDKNSYQRWFTIQPTTPIKNDENN